jgi:glycosyltransferase involved in cell wall biosynthesis
MKRRILFISHSSLWGGAENCLHSLLAELDRARYEPLVVLPAPGPLEERLSNLGIRTRVAELAWCLATTGNKANDRVRFLAGLRRRTLALAEIIKSEEIDVVFTNSLTMMDGAVAAYLAGVPHVWQVLELLDADPDLHLPIDLASFYQLVDLLSEKIVTVSDSVKSDILQYCSSENITTVYTGIDVPSVVDGQDIRRELNVGPDEMLISFVGRLSRRKGVLDLIEAARQVVRAKPESRFVVAGADGGVEEAARRAVNQNGLAPYFTFLGFRNDSLNIVAGSDIFVLPSLADPLPVTVLESMFLGKPVVATRSGGASEMVVDNETGCLVPVGDAAAMASAIIRVLDNPERARRMGDQGRQRAKELFNQKRYAADIEKILDGIPATTKAPSGVALVKTILELFEGSAADKAMIAEQERRLRDYDALVQKLKSNPAFKAYHWLKYLGRDGENTPSQAANG